MESLSFYSLQTGRRFLTDDIDFLMAELAKFLFPSNGTAFPNANYRQDPVSDKVSIPFNREGVSEPV